MDRKKYDKQLIKWTKNHYWDSLEKDKDLILRHLRTFAEDSCEDGNLCNCSCHEYYKFHRTCCDRQKPETPEGDKN